MTGTELADHLAPASGAPSALTEPEGDYDEASHEVGRRLLDDICSALERYIVFPCIEQVWALALWVVHTYLFEEFETTPYLQVKSPTKQAGKSTLFGVLSLLVARPWKVVDVSEAVLFRKVAANKPTLLLDEVDATFGKDSKMTEGLRGILNAGYECGGTVARCVGKDFDAKDFSVYCPKAFAGIGDTLPDTVRDRAIPIELRRRAQTERKPDRFRSAHSREALSPLAVRLAKWTETIREGLGLADPDLPDKLSDRQQDSWESLAAIADRVGGEWPARARDAAVKLHGTPVEGDASLLLLLHIREAFSSKGGEELSTPELLEILIDRGDDSPWARWWGEDFERDRLKSLGSKLARLLKPYGIRPIQLWVGQGGDCGHKVRGYRRSDLQVEWERYLPPEPGPPDENGRTVEAR